MTEPIKEASEELAQWLSYPTELGCRPAKVEFTTEFDDPDGIHCMIFRFQKTLLGKWLLGIVSESGTFSEMQEYHKESELEDATRILEMLKAYWKQQDDSLVES